MARADFQRPPERQHRRRRGIGIQSHRSALSLVLVVVLGSGLAGCDLVGSGSSVTAPQQQSASPLNPLDPVVPTKLTSTTAGKETVRLADEIQGMIAKTDIVFVDDHHQVVAATTSAGSYYGVLRTVSVDPKFDSVTQTKAMAKLLETAGWTERQTADASGKYLVALSSSRDDATSWFLLLGTDTADKKPVITIQLASPDLP